MCAFLYIIMFRCIYCIYTQPHTQHCHLAHAFIHIHSSLHVILVILEVIFFFVDVTPDVLSKHLAICARHTLLQTTSHAHPSELNYNAANAWRFVCSRITFSHSKILWRREKRSRVSRKERWDEEKKNPNRVYNKCRSHFFTISHNTHASSYSCSVCIFHINSGMRSGL